MSFPRTPLMRSFSAILFLLMLTSVTLARDYVVPDEPLNIFYDGEYRAGVMSLSTDSRFVLTIDTKNDDYTVYLFDRQTNVTEVVNLDDEGNRLLSEGYSDFLMASVSDDGRYVVFSREYNNDQSRIYLRDRVFGQTQELPADGIGETDPSSSYSLPRITPNGRYVLFNGADDTTPDGVSDNCTLYPTWTRPCPGVFVYDITKGSIERISINSARQPANSWAGYGDISDNGRYVVFISDATNLGGPNEICGEEDTEQGLYPCGYIYLHDRLTNITTYLPVPHASAAAIQVVLHGMNISGNGRYLAYPTFISTGEDTGYWRAFFYDLLTGTSREIIKYDEHGIPTLNPTFLGGFRALSDDGRYLLIREGAHLHVYDSVVDELVALTDSSGQPYVPNDLSPIPYPVAMSGDGHTIVLPAWDYDGPYYHLPFLAPGETAVPAPYSEVELVTNGGAETQGVMTRMAQDWQVTDYRAGRRRCDYFPHTDSCVFQIKPVTGKIARFTQSVPAVNNPGDVLKFSAYVRGFNVSRATMRVLVNYTDGTSAFVKIPAAQLNGTYDYKKVTATMMLDKLASSIKVQMYIHYRGTGKLLVDDVSLMLGGGAPGVIEMPPPPSTPTPDGSLLPGRITH